MPGIARGLPPARPLARRIARAISVGHYRRQLVRLLDRRVTDETEDVFLDRIKDRKIGESFIARPMPDFED